MKLTGLILGALMVVAAVFLAVLPTSSCGVPLLNAVQPIDSVSTLVSQEPATTTWDSPNYSLQAQEIRAEEISCRADSVQHLFAAGVIALVGLAVGAPLFAVGLRDERRRRALSAAQWPAGPPAGPPPGW